VVSEGMIMMFPLGSYVKLCPHVLVTILDGVGTTQELLCLSLVPLDPVDSEEMIEM